MRSFTVVGFNDEVAKFHGPCQMFAPEDQFATDSLPSESELHVYAEHRGYLPRHGRGISRTQCQPVYLVHDPVEVGADSPNPFKSPRVSPETSALARFLERHQGVQ